MYVNWKKSLLWALALTVVLSTTTAMAAPPEGKGKPPKDEPTTELPPVRYQVQFFNSPNSAANGIRVLGVNNSGQAVGEFGSYNSAVDIRAFLYDPLWNPPSSIDQAIDLNDIVAGIPEGWAIRKATAINDLGDIAVYLMPIGSLGGDYQAAMIDMHATSPQLRIIPDSDLTNHSLATDMNDLGDIVVQYTRKDDGTIGVYVYNFDLYGEPPATPTLIDLDISAAGDWPMINNSVQVLTKLWLADGSPCAFRATLGATITVETFPGFEPLCFNNRGEFGGRISVELKGNRTGDRPYIMGSELEVFPNPDNIASASAQNLNDTSDFNARGYLYHRSWGYVNLVDLLDPSDPNTVTWNATVENFYIWKISNRDDTDFFTIFGSVNNSTLGFVLTPVAAP